MNEFAEVAMSDKYINNEPKPCLRCGEQSTQYQAGRAVYAMPCGCYLGSFKLVTIPILKKGDQLSIL
jgi:hypothetical protein